jgi:broad specificity phosphatase PhoE
MLHLVRHGRPRMDPERPASSWGLHTAAVADVAELRGSGALPTADTVWFSSDEPKALETATLLGGPVCVLPDLGEAQRPVDWLPDEEFEATVTRSMQMPDLPGRAGWETASDVQSRVYAAVCDEALTGVGAAGAQYGVLVGHGTAWTRLVAALTGRPPDVAAWRGMSMPDHCALELTVGVRPGHSGHSRDASARLVSAVVVQPWGHWRSS